MQHAHEMLFTGHRSWTTLCSTKPPRIDNSTRRKQVNTSRRIYSRSLRASNTVEHGTAQFAGQRHFAILSFAFLVLSQIVARGAELPNIVIILADDLGYGDATCYNPDSKIPTPNMDRLAEQGLRFTDAHTPSSVCTPTRYGLLTGQYCWRTRLKEGVLDGFSPPLIERDRITLASMLKRSGYSTACIGKWHLGMQWKRLDGSLETEDRGQKGFRGGEAIDFNAKLSGGPTDVGFDSYFGISASLDMPPYCWIENERCVQPPNGMTSDHRKELFRTQTEGKSHDNFKIDAVLPELKRRTLQTIDRHFSAKANSPLFLYLPINSPHLPVAPSQDFIGKSQAGLYGDFVVETDDYIGSVYKAFEANKAIENTLIIVTSDNGGLWHQWTPEEQDDRVLYKPTERAAYTASFGHHSNAQLRGTKADIYEGGHRVTFLLHWLKGVPKPKIVDSPIELTDVLATLADIVDVKLPNSIDHDSCSFANLLNIQTKNSPPRDVLVHHSLNGLFSIRVGKWKFVEARGSGGFSSPKTIKPKGGEPHGQLYNIVSDPRETKNVFADHPDLVSQLSLKLETIKASSRLSNIESKN
jgi:arylsulfatase A